MARAKVADPVEAALEKLGALRSEEERIRDRLRALDGKRMSLREQLRRTEIEFQAALAGGLLEAPEGVSGRLAELKARLSELDKEEEKLKGEAERVKQEQIGILRDAIRPAWQAYVKAYEVELSTAPKVVGRVRKALEPLFQARAERRKAEGEVDRLLAMAERLAGPRAKSAVAGRLSMECPPPAVPDDSDFEGKRAWRTAAELIRLFSARVWTDPDYIKR